MAEALGAAGSIAGLIGLAGQIAQGVLFLHGFFNDIRDAPDEIRDLRVELDQYQRLYEGLEKLSQRFEPLGLTNNAFEDVEAALVPCKAWTDKLVRKISKYTLKDGPEGRRRRLWSQISVAIRKQRYREYLAALERAKSTLLAAQTSLNTTILLHQTSLSSKGSSSHQATSSSQSSLAPNITEDISAGRAETSKDQGACAAVITQTYDAVMDMKDISGQIDESVHTLLANQAGNSSLIESALKKILRENMNEINEIQANMPTAAANGAIHLKSMFARRQEEPQSDPGLVALAHEHESHRIGVSIDSDSGLHRTAIRTRTVGVRRYSFWFGTMIMITTTRIRNRRNESSTDIPLAQQTTEIRLVPANFLTSFAMSATITRVAAEYRKPSMFLNLEPLRIVHQHSPIIIAIRCGDLFEVQKLLGAGHAALSDCLLDGQTLLDACFKPMEEMCELRESESNEYPETSHYYVKGFSNEELEKWSRSVRLIGWLVKQGVDPGRTHVGSCGFNEGTFFNVMSALTNMEYFKESRHIVEHDFHEMAELMLRSAKTNPIDCTDKPHCLIHMMNKYVCKNMRLPILDILLSQTDWGFDWTTLRKKDGVFLLEALFTWTPEDWVIQGVWEPRLRPEHIQLLQNRSAILRRMIRAAAEIKDPIPTSTSGTPLHINDSVLAVHAGIREALYVVRPALTREIRLDRSWRVLRRSTITDIGTFLGYDATVLAIKQRGETLTECAWRWKVIDIWKEALSEAGYDTHMLLGLDRNPSKLPEHRSSKAGTTATAGVWGAAPIGPSKIAVYLDFPTTLGSLSIEELSWEVGEDDSQRFFREPGLIRSSCDISQHGEELCVHINEGRPEDEKADLFHLEGTDHEFSRGESNIDAGVFAKILGTAGALLSVIY